MGRRDNKQRTLAARAIQKARGVSYTAALKIVDAQRSIASEAATSAISSVEDLHAGGDGADQVDVEAE